MLRKTFLGLGEHDQKKSPKWQNMTQGKRFRCTTGFLGVVGLCLKKGEKNNADASEVEQLSRLANFEENNPGEIYQNRRHYLEKKATGLGKAFGMG